MILRHWYGTSSSSTTRPAREIACSCDLRIAAQTSRFGVPINRLGFPLAHAELTAMLGAVGMEVTDVEGIAFTPMRGLHLSEDVRLNYLVAARGR